MVDEMVAERAAALVAAQDPLDRAPAKPPVAHDEIVVTAVDVPAAAIPVVVVDTDDLFVRGWS